MANEIAPGIPVSMASQNPVSEPNTPKNISRCTSVNFHSKAINYITVNKQILYKLQSKSLLPVKDSSWVKSIRSPASQNMSNYWDIKRKLAITPDNVKIHKIKTEIFVSPIHSKCESCKVHQFPLRLVNPLLLNKTRIREFN